MSLSDDFRMYFGDTWVGYRLDGVVLPFLVQEIRLRESEFTGDIRNTSDMYGNHENLRALQFRGYIIRNRSGSTEEITAQYNDENLVLETPDLGYTKLSNGKWVWVSVAPSHSVKKGLCDRRLNHPLVLDHQPDVYSLFCTRPEDYEELVTRDLLIKDEIIFYKGKQVGVVENGVYQIPSELPLLGKILTQEIEDCQLIISSAFQ